MRAEEKTPESLEARLAEFQRRRAADGTLSLEAWLAEEPAELREALRRAWDDLESFDRRPKSFFLSQHRNRARSTSRQPLVEQALPARQGKTRFFRRHRDAEQDTGDASPGGPEPGRILGDFRLVRFLAKGGMGQVWEAEQLSLGGRRVALKLVLPGRYDARSMELFGREARAGGRLQHPGIVSVYGHGTSEGLAWIAMELVEGSCTLKDFLEGVAREPEVPPGYDRAVACLVAEIADAMHVAHREGVIHRDLKPQNVLITQEERPKVSDFGLARLTDETALSVTGEFAGTYFYMSPEQVAAKRARIDHRTDVFSLGVVLYELLTLQRPFQGDTTHQVAAQILMKDPPDPRTYRSKVPRDLAVIAGKALEKDRDKRFPTMAELAADLRRYLADEPILARPPRPLERLVKWTRRNPAKSVASGIAAVAFAVVTVLSVALYEKSEESNQRRVAAEQSAERERLAADAAKASERRAVAGEDLAEARRLEAQTAAERERLAAEEAKASELRAVAGEELAEARRLEAEAAAERERLRADEVLQLSAVQVLRDLEQEARRLWPAHPVTIDAYRMWIEKAESLVVALPRYEQKLSELRAKAKPWTEDEPEAARLEAEVSRRLDWIFEDSQDRWWHNQLVKLVDDLKALADVKTGLLSYGISPEHGWGMRKRLDFALTIAERSIEGEEPRRRWSEAIESIANPGECPAYNGLQISPQIGLLPIGRDPASGLWEFAHLQTGQPPQRDTSGKLVLMEESSLVLVLLPEGSCPIKRNVDELESFFVDEFALRDKRYAASHLGAFFLSKYEMTQAQWQRTVVRNPSMLIKGSFPFGLLGIRSSSNLPSSPQFPVDSVTWHDCISVAFQLGVRLPTNFEWEYGARAETTTDWWRSDTKFHLGDAGNILDRQAASWARTMEVEHYIDDGSAFLAKIGSYLPNAFGLHDVIGNVAEYCFEDRVDAVSERTKCAHGARAMVLTRGGSFMFDAKDARSSFKYPVFCDTEFAAFGLRLARSLDP